MNHIPERFSDRAGWRMLYVAVAAVAAIAVWLSWPGFATHDTVFLTQEVERGVFTTYHPLLNGVLLRILAVPFESFAPYMLLQVLLCAALFARATMLVAPGGPGRATWLTWVLWAASAPTLLYLGMLWKDVPLAYGLVFAAAMGYRVHSDPAYRVSRTDGVLLALAMVAATSLRHGTAVNLLLIPLLLGVGHLRRQRRILVACIVAAGIWVLLAFAARTSLVTNDEVHYARLKLGAVSQPFLGIVSNRNGYATDDPVYDDQLARRAFGASYAQAYTPDYFRNEVAPLSLHELEELHDAIVLRTPRLCAMNVSLCISGRLQMMLGTLQPSTRFGGMTFYDLGSMPNCETVYGMSPPACETLHRYGAGERSAVTARLVERIRVSIADARGAWSTLYAWNLLPALGLLVVSLVVLSPRAPAWRVAFFFVMQSALPFATAMANDYRYYYFLSPYLCVFLPSAALAIWNAFRVPQHDLETAR